jgi:hypothetical protein
MLMRSFRFSLAALASAVAAFCAAGDAHAQQSGETRTASAGLPIPFSFYAGAAYTSAMPELKIHADGLPSGTRVPAGGSQFIAVPMAATIGWGGGYGWNLYGTVGGVELGLGVTGSYPDSFASGGFAYTHDDGTLFGIFLLPGVGWGVRRNGTMFGAQVVPKLTMLTTSFKAQGPSGAPIQADAQSLFFSTSLDLQACLDRNLGGNSPVNSLFCAYVAPTVFDHGQWLDGAALGVRWVL